MPMLSPLFSRLSFAPATLKTPRATLAASRAAFAAAAAACALGCAEDDAKTERVGAARRALYKPVECSVAVDQAIHRATQKYDLPRWFYYAIAHRESTFDPNAVNPTDGGVGLTQLTNPVYNGQPYPENLSAPNNNYNQWRWDMGLDGANGPWINMADVSRLDTWSDPDENLDRFSSGYAAPAYTLWKNRYGLTDPVEILKRVAFHWNQGVFATYDPNHWYMPQYNQYVATYKPPVDAEDGAWAGPPDSPPYDGGGASHPFTSSATASPSCVAPGAAVSITGSFTNGGGALSGTNVDVEVFNASHANVGQNYWSNQAFSAAQSRQFVWSWAAPSTPGTYGIEAGVFDAAWQQLHWNSSAGTLTVHGDAAPYNFECGSQQGWAFDGAIVSSIGVSTAQKYQGSSSLAVNFNGAAAGLPDVYVTPGAAPAAGAVVTYRVWVPAGSNLAGVQAYVKQGAAGGWAWTGTYRPINTLTANAWNAIAVTVPANAVTPLYQVGVEFSTNGAWTGTAYVDSISW
jgi:hypothetical protein